LRKQRKRVPPPARRGLQLPRRAKAIRDSAIKFSPERDARFCQHASRSIDEFEAGSVRTSAIGA
jgi:hypothetical protein